MKLSEIEGVKEVNTWIGGLPYTVEPVDKLHTPEQMQEYAKAKVYEALYKHTSFGTGKEELVKHMTEEFFAENIFEEDTKND